MVAEFEDEATYRREICHVIVEKLLLKVSSIITIKILYVLSSEVFRIQVVSVETKTEIQLLSIEVENDV